MDAGQIAELRRWGEQLVRDESHPELRPAGRAILLLVDEVERLRAGSRAGPDEGGPDAQDPGPDSQPPAEPQPRRPRRRSRRGFLRFAIAVGILGVLAFATLALGARLSGPTMDAEGPARDAGIGPAQLPRLRFSVGADPGVLDRVRWRLDGVDVTTRAYLSGGRLVFDGSSLRDGRHVLTASASGSFPGSRTTERWRFAVDTTGPRIRLDPPGATIPAGRPIRIRGTLEPGASLTADGRPVLVDKGRFALSWPVRTRRPVTLVATDPLRNATTRRISIAVEPRLPPRPVRAVHVSFAAWADPGLRRGILALVGQGRVNAVELDLKGEAGTVGWNADVALARRIGAVRPLIDLAAAVRDLHRRGIRVIGRLVCFRDPILAAAAWRSGARDEVVQTPAGAPYRGYGGFTNLANPVVRRYQIAIATQAARLGVDEILYDYVRRPDGPAATMTFPGLRGTPEQAIVSFLAETRAALRPYHVLLGASVFGVSATRPQEVAQDVPAMANELDYVAPMVYPSHWGPGEYGVPSPNRQPYQIVLRSLEDFERDVRGTGARVVPWLQDFSLGVPYRAKQVEAQIEAAHDAGIDEYLLWNPAVTYTASALPRDARTVRFRRQPTRAELLRRLKPNELGVVPVIMHHQVRGHGSPVDITPAELRDELTRLWRDGFYPVRAIDLVSGRLDVPRGHSPVVLTFDDADNNQVAFLPDGRLDPRSGVGVLQAFAATHRNFPASATFFVPRNAFVGNGRTPDATLRWLVQHGYELGNHTRDHIPLDTLVRAGVERQLVLGNRLLSELVPGYRPRTMALPGGNEPHPATLAVRGSWHGQSYRFAGVFLAGAQPAPSPFSSDWDAAAIPRILTDRYRSEAGVLAAPTRAAGRRPAPAAPARTPARAPAERSRRP